MFVLVGDAELDEGSNNEAIVYAGAVGLANLVVIAVDNQSSSYGWGAGRDRGALRGERLVGGAGVRPGSCGAFLGAGFGSGPGPRLVVASVEGKS